MNDNIFHPETSFPFYSSFSSPDYPFQGQTSETKLESPLPHIPFSPQPFSIGLPCTLSQNPPLSLPPRTSMLPNLLDYPPTPSSFSDVLGLFDPADSSLLESISPFGFWDTTHSACFSSPLSPLLSPSWVLCTHWWHLVPAVYATAISSFFLTNQTPVLLRVAKCLAKKPSFFGLTWS